MKIDVKVIPGARVKKIEVIGEGNLKIWLRHKPSEGQANSELVEVVSEYFKIPKSSVKILRGLKSRDKVIEIVR